jgi:hypothetical protein
MQFRFGHLQLKPFQNISSESSEISTELSLFSVESALCGTIIKYTHLLVHLISSYLAGGVEEGEDSSGHRFYAVLDLV